LRRSKVEHDRCGYYERSFVAGRGLMSYGINLLDPFRHAAEYVDRILKGEKPAEMPVQAPTKYQLVINLKTAKEMDFTFPPAVLARADEVNNHFAALHESAFGPKRTSLVALHMSAFGCKADMTLSGKSTFAVAMGVKRHMSASDPLRT